MLSTYSRSLIKLSASLAALIFSQMAIAAGDASRGEVLADTCNGCHAVESYNNAIGFFGKTRLILFQRGNAKRMLEDYESAVEDYNLSIEIKPDAGIYYNRAICKYYLNNKFGACQDALKAEEFGFDASKMTKAACN